MTRQQDDQHATPLPQTSVPGPRHRVFLLQSFPDRVKNAVWSVARVFLFRPTPGVFSRARVWLLRLFGATIDSTAFISASALIEYPWNLTIGANVHIDHKVILNCMGKVTIGSGTRISQHAHVCAGTHDYQRRDMMIVRKPITIGNDVWIAADAFVGPGVTIGDHCVLAARSSAFHDLPAGQVCVGEPARPRHDRDQESNAPAEEAVH